jgi:hypothetical protein
MLEASLTFGSLIVGLDLFVARKFGSWFTIIKLRSDKNATKQLRQLLYLDNGGNSDKGYWFT